MNKLESPRTNANEMHNDVVQLFEKKNWPDFRESWSMKGEQGPVVVTSVATTGGKTPRELAGSMSPAWGQPWDARALGNVSTIGLNLMPNDLKKLPEESQQAIRDARKATSKMLLSSNHNQITTKIEQPKVTLSVQMI